MASVTLSSKFQFSIPKAVREELNLRAGQQFAVITKGDIISQAEREIFRERLLEMNPKASLVNANGLSGQGAAELAARFQQYPEVELSEMRLRHTAPLSVCTLCVGETRVAKEHHRGILRRIDGFQSYAGE